MPQMIFRNKKGHNQYAPWLKWCLLILVLLDLIYSFGQHYFMPLDGDMSSLVLPNKYYQPVMNDPFGMGALLEGKSYAGTNRFFCHWFIVAYFNTVPFLLQNFTDPLTSIYLSCALLKTTTQLVLIVILAAYISGRVQFFSVRFLGTALLVTPFFQTWGYYIIMGIIDPATSYTIFYGLPMAGLLLFFFPFYQTYFLQKPLKFSWPFHFGLFSLTIILPFSGPLIPPLCLLVCPTIILFHLWRNWKEFSFQYTQIWQAVLRIPKPIIFYFSLISVLSLYSLYIGTFNSEQLTPYIPWGERYIRLLKGLGLQFSQKLGMPILFLGIIINVFLVRKYLKQEDQKPLLKILKWLAIFSVIYLLLLPLGGYRVYRPLFIRRDTMMPIILVMIYFFSLTSLSITLQFSLSNRKVYWGFLGLIMIIFTAADLPNKDPYYCERQAIEMLAQSKETEVELNGNCTIMAWKKLEKPIESENNTLLLQRYGVLKEKKLYYQK